MARDIYDPFEAEYTPAPTAPTYPWEQPAASGGGGADPNVYPNGLPPTGGPGDRRTGHDGQVYQWDGSAWTPWNNGASAYEQEQQGIRPQFNPDTQLTGNGGGYDPGAMGGDGSFDASGFQWPQYDSGPSYQSGPAYQPQPYTPYPQFQPPPAFSYDAFSYGDFKAPSLQDAQNEPGYDFAMQQGQKALENSAAARGTLRTGGTMKDLFAWGNKFGEQNYGNVYNRSANTYGTNRANAFGSWQGNRNNAADNYSMNYGVSRDTWDRGNQQNTDNYNIADRGARDAFTLNNNERQGAFDRQRQSSLDAFQPQFDSAKLSFEDMYRRWKAGLDANTQLATAGAYGD